MAENKSPRTLICPTARKVEELPLLEADLAIAFQNRMLAELLIVAAGIIVAKVGAAALGAGQGRTQNGVGNTAHGLGFAQSTASLPLLHKVTQSRIGLRLRGNALLQCDFVAEQAGIRPHGLLQMVNVHVNEIVLSLG